MNVRKSASNMNANLNESINGVRVTQAFNRQERNVERFMRINQVNRNANVRAVRLDNLIWPLFDFVGVAGTVLLVIVGANQVIAGALTIGVIAAFINYLWRFWAPISALSRVYSQVLSAMENERLIWMGQLEFGVQSSSLWGPNRSPSSLTPSICPQDQSYI